MNSRLVVSSETISRIYTVAQSSALLNPFGNPVNLQTVEKPTSRTQSNVALYGPLADNTFFHRRESDRHIGRIFLRVPLGIPQAQSLSLGCTLDMGLLLLRT